MYFDTHTHANFAAFESEKEGVIKRALDQDVWLANVGTSFATSKSAAETAKGYKEGVYATVGLHPGHTWQDMKDSDESEANHKEVFVEDEYAALLSDKVVAIGEIGLDYFRLPLEDEASRQLQKDAFAAQLHFAQKYELPVVIHCRDAYDDCLEILKAEYKGGGILHSFTGDWPTAKKFLDIGFHVALNGILMFDKTGRLNEVCKNLPADRILSETDAPYLAPPPHRGKRNEPAFVRYIVDFMAQIRWVDPAEMADQTFRNAVSVYNLGNKKTAQDGG
jgi:TatD DNase family protein